jgi:uncharacterized protein (TIGR02246 family)
MVAQPPSFFATPPVSTHETMVAIMQHIRATLLSLILLTVSTATALPQSLPPQSTAIPVNFHPPHFSALREEWADNLHNRNLEAAIALYAPDAAFLQPDGTRVEGRPAIRNLYQTVMATFDSTIQFNSHTVEYSKDLAFDSGTYNETLTNRKTGTTIHTSASYLTIYRRSPEDKWLIIQQAWPNAPTIPN